MDPLNDIPADFGSGPSNQTIGEASSETTSTISAEASSPANALSRRTSWESLIAADHLLQDDVEENDDEDDEEDGGDDEEEEEETNEHPRCIYTDIGLRDISAELKSQLLGSNNRLRDLLSTAQARKYSFYETRMTSALSKVQDVTERQWEQLLAVEYQRQARAQLEALEADIAYFRQLLKELVDANYRKRLDISYEDYLEWRDRIQNEIGDTRADILVLRLRAPMLMAKFVFVFHKKRQINQDDWTYADRLIPRYRSPSPNFINSHRSWLLLRKIESYRRKQLPKLLQNWGYQKELGGWSVGGTFTPSDRCSIGKLIPDFLPEDLAQHIFGRNTTHVDSTQSAIPMLQLDFGHGFLAPAIPQDRKLDIEDSALLESSSPNEKWIYVDLDAASEKRDNPLHARFYRPLRLLEFKTSIWPGEPDQRYAYLHLLLTMLQARRTRGPDGDWRQDMDEFLRAERWDLQASGIRKSTLVRLAVTIGLMDDSEARIMVGIDEDTDQTDADDTAEVDMLITNIFEEHLVPSPEVDIDEWELEPLDLKETDIIAEMQRRRNRMFARENQLYDN